MIKGWPEELTFMLADIPAVNMPELYFEYLLAKTAMHYTGLTWLRTDPEVFHIIEEMSFDGQVYSIFTYERNDT